MNSRNKLLLKLARNHKTSDISKSEDLTKLLQNSNGDGPNTGCPATPSPTHSDIEKLPLNVDTLGLFRKNGDADSSQLDFLGDDTFKEMINDLNESDNADNFFCDQLNLSESTKIALQDGGNQVMQNDYTLCRSETVTPVPSKYNSFASSPEKARHSVQNPASFCGQVAVQLQQLVVSVSSPVRSRNQSPFELSTNPTTSATEASSEWSSPSSTSGRKRRKFTIDSSKKKRKCMKNNWLDTKRKLLVNRGQEHLSRGGKLQQGKKLKPPCDSCKLKCYTKFTAEQRQRIFDEFWGLGDHVKQWQFIGKYTKQFTKRRNTTQTDSRRNYSVQYFFPGPSETRSTIKICKTMFKNTLNISNQFIQSGINKYNITTGSCDIDKRGIHSNKKIVLTENVIKSVCDHVKSFCPVESHYIRKDSNKLYLDSNLDFVKMFRMYNQWVIDNNIIDKVTTLRQYRDVVNTHMNVGFFIPKKDQCDICTANKNKSTTEDSNNNFNQHIRNKNIARSLKAEDKKYAQCNPKKISAATFDFQKILCTPHGETSSFYYKRKLSVFNFTVFDMGLKRGICYVWDETIGKRGSNEVASNLLRYITKVTESGIKDIRLWSDNCGGQNRNRSVFSMYLYAVNKLKVRICHRFLEKGHTQQEGDSVHALIERSSKRKTIYSPQEWYTCMRWCKVTDDPYEVIEINQRDILDFKSFLKQYTWLKNTMNEKVAWNQVREIRVEPETPNIIYYKYDLNDAQSMSIDCCRRTNTRRHQNILKEVSIAYSEALPITSAKYRDLMSLCDQNLIPPRYHDYYKNIIHSSTEVIASDQED